MYYGNFDICDFLIELKNNNKIQFDVNYDKIFTDIFEYKFAEETRGSFESAKWIYQHITNNNLELNVDYQYICEEASKCGYLDRIQWLCLINKTIDLTNVYDNALYYSHIHIVQYLYPFVKDNLVNCNFTARIVCLNNNIESLNFMIENYKDKIDFHYDNNKIMKDLFS